MFKKVNIILTSCCPRSVASLILLVKRDCLFCL